MSRRVKKFESLLKSIGVKDAFEANLLDQRNLTIAELLSGDNGNKDDLPFFFGGGFVWGGTPEGNRFWGEKDEEFLKLFEENEK